LNCGDRATKRAHRQPQFHEVATNDLLKLLGGTMDKRQHLLIKLGEECNEIGKVVSKSLLFGLGNGHPDRRKSNKEDLCNELNDLFAVVEMLYEFIEWRIDRGAVQLKKAKVERYLAYSRELGITDEF